MGSSVCGESARCAGTWSGRIRRGGSVVVRTDSSTTPVEDAACSERRCSRCSATHPDERGGMSVGRLDGKVAVITGASSGLGPVMAARFVREGARVLLAARREERVREAAAAAGQGALAMRADVTDESDVVAMIARAVEAFGYVDV